MPSIEFPPPTGHLHASCGMVPAFNPTQLTEYVDTQVRVPMYNIVFHEVRPLRQWDSPVPDMAMMIEAKEGSKAAGEKKGDDKATKPKLSPGKMNSTKFFSSI